MDARKIDRINTLAHKAKSVGLTDEEKREQTLLREEYLESIRASLRSRLDSIVICHPSGYI